MQSTLPYRGVKEGMIYADSLLRTNLGLVPEHLTVVEEQVPTDLLALTSLDLLAESGGIHCQPM